MDSDILVAMPLSPRLVDVASAEGTTRIRWSDGVTDAVTALWLRDACHCALCRAPQGGQRYFDVAEIPVGLELRAAEIVGDGLAVRFSDGHRGEVPDEALARRRREPSRPRWDARHADILRDGATAGHGDLTAFVRALDRDGVALARDVTPRRGALAEFAGRIGHIRETNYGAVFDVATAPDPANLANSGLALALHTDNPYRDPVPTVQLLHCLAASGLGGVTRLVDGWAAADRLARVNPRAHGLLTRRAVPFRFADGEVDLQARSRIIELDVDDHVVVVRVNSRSMEPPDLPAEELDAFYGAYRAFVGVLSEPDAAIELTLQPGDVLALDNRRVLHGRSGFEPDSGRLLQGCYVDIDAVRSTVRVAAGGRR